MFQRFCFVCLRNCQGEKIQNPPGQTSPTKSPRRCHKSQQPARVKRKKWGTKGGGTADWASRTFFCNLLLGDSKLRLFIVVLLAVRNICPVSPGLPKPQNGRLRRSNHNFRAVTSRLNIALQRRRGNQPANCYGAGARRAKCNALLLASWNLSELHC